MRQTIASSVMVLLALSPRLHAEQTSALPPATETFQQLCQALADNYPMLEYAGWSDRWVQEYKAKVAAAPTRRAAFELMDELVCRLNDYHTRFIWPDRPRLASPALRVEPVFTSDHALPNHGDWQARPSIELPSLDGIAIAVVAADRDSGLQAGDEIMSVDDELVRNALERQWRHAACSSAMGKLRAASNRILQGSSGSELRLTIRRQTEGGQRVLQVRLPRSGSAAEPTVSNREIDGVPVIRIIQWTNPRGVIRIGQWTSSSASDLASNFDRLLDGYKDRRGIIIDVRGNGGGEDALASKVVGRFLKTPVIASISFHREVPGVTFNRTVDMTEPRGPWRYEGRVAVLTDEGCMSACEHFVSGMSEAGALLCGTPTSGACGWIRPVDLPGGAKLYVSQTFPLHTGGLPSPLMGIAPHLWAPRVLADLRAGKDTALMAALGWIKSENPVPTTRSQPLSNFTRGVPADNSQR